MNHLFAVVLWFALLGSNAVRAQGTLGDLLDAGAVKLSRQEVLDTISGATVSVSMSAGGSTLVEYKADGSYSGSYLGRPGTRGAAKEGGLFGKWKVGENGRLCAEGLGRGDKETDHCTFIYRLEGRYYESPGAPANRSAPVHQSTIRR